MKPSLPPDLISAQEMAANSVVSYLKSQINSRQTVNFKFEGLKDMPIAKKLFDYLNENKLKPLLLWLDAGTTALAKNNFSSISSSIYSYKEFISTDIISNSDNNLIVVSPGAYDYKEIEKLSELYLGSIIILNGKLEDSSVGIGSVARMRRKTFLNTWLTSFWLQPLNSGALIRAYPDDWQLFRLDNDGYRFLESFKQKPTNEQIFELLPD